MKIMDVKNISKSFGEKQILDNISFSLDKGKCLCLVGQSGSGKSTIAKMCIGLLYIDEGDIYIKDISRKKANSDKHLDRELSKIEDIIFQDSLNSCNPNMTVREIIEEVKNENTAFDINELISMVNLNENILDLKPKEISGGQLKRVCIARTIALHPELIIFDESIAGLDPLIRDNILDLLIDLQNKFGLSYLFITHDLEAAYYLSDEVILLQKGKISAHFKDIDKEFSEFLDFRKTIESNI